MDEMMLIERHFRKIRSRHKLSEEEETAILGALTTPRTIEANQTVVHAGAILSISMVLLDGMMCRYKDMADGRRQISEICVPGDPTDLHSYTLKRLDHNIATLSDCTVAILPHDRARPLFEAYPRIARLYWFGTNLDAAIHREWTVSLGRRKAVERVAALICELRLRLAAVGLGDETGFDLPLTQEQLAECLGLTPVHVNRMLRELRERKLMEFKGGRVDIADLEGLVDLAQFDPAYLYIGQVNDF